MQVKMIKYVLSVIALGIFVLTGTSCGPKQDGVEDELRLGVLMPLTGGAASYGVDGKRGVELALETYQPKREFTIRPFFEDSKADPANAISAFRKLSGVNRIDALVGSLFSVTSLSLAPIAQQEGVVMITPASSDEAVPEAGDLIFSFYPSATLEGELVGQQIVSDGVSKIAVLYQDVKAARDLAVALSSYVKRNGVEVVVEESLPSEENYNSLVAKLGNPEATFICAYIDPLLQFVQKSHEMGMETKWYSQSTLYEEAKVKKNASVLEGIVFSAPYFNKFSDDEEVRLFRDSYRKKFGEDPSVWSAFAYDSCMAILQAYDLYPNDIADGLRRIEFQGATGPTSFDGSGRPSKKMIMVTVKHGEIIPISQ